MEQEQQRQQELWENEFKQTYGLSNLQTQTDHMDFNLYGDLSWMTFDTDQLTNSEQRKTLNDSSKITYLNRIRDQWAYEYEDEYDPLLSTHSKLGQIRLEKRNLNPLLPGFLTEFNRYNKEWIHKIEHDPAFVTKWLSNSKKPTINPHISWVIKEYDNLEVSRATLHVYLIYDIHKRGYRQWTKEGVRAFEAYQRLYRLQPTDQMNLEDYLTNLKIHREPFKLTIVRENINMMEYCPFVEGDYNIQKSKLPKRKEKPTDSIRAGIIRRF